MRGQPGIFDIDDWLKRLSVRLSRTFKPSTIARRVRGLLWMTRPHMSLIYARSIAKRLRSPSEQ
jgi:hypothetical protein